MQPFLKRYAKWHWKGFVKGVDHATIVHGVTADAILTQRFLLMVTLSSAIAVLGLLLSSPAVVIGAMLLSPLMGPIMAMGFALCLLDIDLFRAAWGSLLSGILLAIGVTFVIVFLSPVTDATPEILARTQPNLFDLLVAIFSGLAGGYASIRRTEGTIVGVAIATALMPPLAVVGYGLATKQWDVARGAAFLFMTNLLAIALSVTALAKWYGFGAQHSPRHTIWQSVLIVAVFGALSFPLGLALKSIGYKGYLTKMARAVVEDDAIRNGAHISQFSVKFPPGRPVQIDALLLTKRFVPNTDKTIRRILKDKLGQDFSLDIEQVVVAYAEPPGSTRQAAVDPSPLAAPAVSGVPELKPAEPVAPAQGGTVSEASIATYVKDLLALPIEAQRINAQAKTMTLLIGPDHGGDASLDTLRSMEKILTAHYPGWQVQLIPPLQPLPPVILEAGNPAMSSAERERLDDIVWALQRWKVGRVQAAGRHAHDVAGALQAAGIKVEVIPASWDGKGKDEQNKVQISLRQDEQAAVQANTLKEMKDGQPRLP